MDWQPIETAPKDGTLILVCVRRGIVCNGKTTWWNEVVPAAYSKVDGNLRPYAPNWSGEIRYGVTQWMPLPEAPAVVDE